ncbi:MAG TPA: glycerophosphodiester phosphodiesterase family protein [Thermomicrobiales bacterium]|nr:glycerophosphodiester phosphodiesterase family protein [Thermomicrobiales bacterium]
MKIYAHRGASIEFPENTLAAFNRAIELGIEGIELDVYLSKDGIPVVIHDPTLDRTTNGTGPIDSLTAAELGALDAGNGEYVPTLAEVLSLVAGKLHVNIEIKTAIAADAVLEEVKNHPTLEWVTSSFVWEALEHVHNVAPDVDCWPLTIGGPQKLDALIAIAAPHYPDADRNIRQMWPNPPTIEASIDAAAKWGGSAISVWEHDLTADDIAAIHARNQIAWVWTVNDADRARELMAIGVDSLCTDDPAMALRVVAEAKQAVVEVLFAAAPGSLRQGCSA